MIKVVFWGASAHCQLTSHFFIYQDPQVLIHRAAHKSIHPPARTNPGDCSNPDGRPGALGLVEFMSFP